MCAPRQSRRLLLVRSAARDPEASGWTLAPLPTVSKGERDFVGGSPDAGCQGRAVAVAVRAGVWRTWYEGRSPKAPTLARGGCYAVAALVCCASTCAVWALGSRP